MAIIRQEFVLAQCLFCAANSLSANMLKSNKKYDISCDCYR